GVEGNWREGAGRGSGRGRRLHSGRTRCTPRQFYGTECGQYSETEADDSRGAEMRAGGYAVFDGRPKDRPKYAPAIPNGAQVAGPVMTGRLAARNLRGPEAGMMRLDADLRFDLDPARAQVQAIDGSPPEAEVTITQSRIIRRVNEVNQSFKQPVSKPTESCQIDRRSAL